LSKEELKKKRIEEEGLEDEETIHLLKVFKNDLILRSPLAATLHDMSLRHFMFFLEDAKKKASTLITMTDEDSQIHAVVVKAVELAYDRTSDLHMYFEQ